MIDERYLDGVIIKRADKEDINYVVDLSARLVKYSASDIRGCDTEGASERRRHDMSGLVSQVYDRNLLVFVAKGPDGRILGNAIVKMDEVDFLSAEKQAWIFDVSVEPEFWGTGISEALMIAVESAAAERGINYVGLTVTAANSRAVNFYSKLGYLNERVQMIKKIEPHNFSSDMFPEF